MTLLLNAAYSSQAKMLALSWNCALMRSGSEFQGTTKEKQNNDKPRLGIIAWTLRGAWEEMAETKPLSRIFVSTFFGWAPFKWQTPDPSMCTEGLAHDQATQSISCAQALQHESALSMSSMARRSLPAKKVLSSPPWHPCTGTLDGAAGVAAASCEFRYMLGKWGVASCESRYMLGKWTPLAKRPACVAMELKPCSTRWRPVWVCTSTARRPSEATRIRSEAPVGGAGGGDTEDELSAASSAAFCAAATRSEALAPWTATSSETPSSASRASVPRLVNSLCTAKATASSSAAARPPGELASKDKLCS
mmetsp:Transcript_126103/g.353102  ORF Transcript_126103/g.353102 Transcript_126103/m.353102 type:complete len:307 (+) Transcript_126103:454-1374(+)